MFFDMERGKVVQIDCLRWYSCRSLRKVRLLSVVHSLPSH